MLNVPPENGKTAYARESASDPETRPPEQVAMLARNGEEERRRRNPQHHRVFRENSQSNDQTKNRPGPSRAPEDRLMAQDQRPGPKTGVRGVDGHERPA